MEGTGYVKWRDLLPLLITIFSITVAISVGALYLHGESPHKDAIPRAEFELFAGNIDDKLDRVMDKLERIEP